MNEMINLYTSCQNDHLILAKKFKKVPQSHSSAVYQSMLGMAVGKFVIEKDEVALVYYINEALSYLFFDREMSVEAFIASNDDSQLLHFHSKLVVALTVENKKVVDAITPHLKKVDYQES